MTGKEISLELASFLDSPEARGLGNAPETTRKVAEAFLHACFEGVGKQPRLLDYEDLKGLLTEGLAAWFAPKDPAADEAPAVLGAYLAHLAATQVVTLAYEQGRALDEHVETFVAEVRSGRNAERQVARQQDPFVHGASKLGRNDPCSCGSGKKYKKCHGKNA